MIEFDIKIWWKWVIFHKTRYYWRYFSLQIEKVIWEANDKKIKVTIFAAYWELIPKISPSPIDDHCNEPQKSAILVRSRRRELMGLLKQRREAILVAHNQHCSPFISTHHAQRQRRASANHGRRFNLTLAYLWMESWHVTHLSQC